MNFFFYSILFLNFSDVWQVAKGWSKKDCLFANRIRDELITCDLNLWWPQQKIRSNTFLNII